MLDLDISVKPMLPVRWKGVAYELDPFELLPKLVPVTIASLDDRIAAIGIPGIKEYEVLAITTALFDLFMEIDVVKKALSLSPRSPASTTESTPAS